MKDSYDEIGRDSAMRMILEACGIEWQLPTPRVCDKFKKKKSIS